MINILQKRHSVRKYASGKIPEAIVNTLKAEATFINSHEAGLNFRIIFDDGAPFDGFSRSYGMFSGVENYMVALIDPTFDNTWERAGFFGQQFVIKAVEAGLGTCFVSGTYSRKNIGISIEVYEKPAFLVTFGYADSKITILSGISSAFMHKKKMSARDFFDGTDEEYIRAGELIPNFSEGLEAIACAPSAMNKRPVRLRLTNNNGVLGVEAYVENTADANMIDLGIAKYNFNAIVNGCWEWGNHGLFIYQPS